LPKVFPLFICRQISRPHKLLNFPNHIVDFYFRWLYNQEVMKLERLTRFVKLLVGKDEYWQRRWKLETAEGRERLEEELLKRGAGFSGVAQKKLRCYEEKRGLEFKDEERKRWLEGLGIIPPWLALIISVVAFVVSIFSLLTK